MKLTVLTENYAGSGFFAEHGLSYLIEMDDEKILFDTGNSNIFLKNAEKLDLDIQEQVNTIVLSHGHWDHGNGLEHLSGKTLFTHPDSFKKRYRKTDRSYVGLSLTKKETENIFELKTFSFPQEIAPGIIFLGEIPRENDFESQSTSFIDEMEFPDYVNDDSALAITENDQLIIVSGCSHAGICNIIEYAKKVTGMNKIRSVIGGFHLKYNNKQTMETIKYFNKENIEDIHPSHCTELEAMLAFSNEFNISTVKTGMTINL